MKIETKLSALNFLQLALTVLKSDDSEQAKALAEEVETTSHLVENFDNLIRMRDEARRLRTSDAAAAAEAEAHAIAIEDEQKRLLGKDSETETLLEAAPAIDGAAQG